MRKECVNGCRKNDKESSVWLIIYHKNVDTPNNKRINETVALAEKNIKANHYRQ
jgi:hypothetical protein